MALPEHFNKMYRSFIKRDSKQLRKIHDKLMKEAVLNPSPFVYESAVFAYVLYKILSKTRFLSPEYNKNLSSIASALKDFMKASNKPQDWKRASRNLEKTIKNLEKTDRRYITDILSKGRLKTAAIIYAQGLSLGLASELAGMDKQQILEYVGQTMMFDRLKEEKDIIERVKDAKKMIEE
ncbi:hypothetical protein JXB01_00835 [Candidatus Micrarchaeota archaeon]|nr:hypothetical protein [Candidatus Micrarchaeota archaeon]